MEKLDTKTGSETAGTTTSAPSTDTLSDPLALPIDGSRTDSYDSLAGELLAVSEQTCETVAGYLDEVNGLNPLLTVISSQPELASQAGPMLDEVARLRDVLVGRLAEVRPLLSQGATTKEQAEARLRVLGDLVVTLEDIRDALFRLSALAATTGDEHAARTIEDMRGRAQADHVELLAAAAALEVRLSAVEEPERRRKRAREDRSVVDGLQRALEEATVKD